MPAFGLVAIGAMLMASRSYAGDIQGVRPSPAEDLHGGAPRPALA